MPICYQTGKALSVNSGICHSNQIFIIMAKQKGIVKLEGSIGDISFYKTSDGFLAREKAGIDKNRIKNDPAFQRTRENGSEFGRAGRAGKVVRTAFKLLLQNSADKKVVSRLMKQLLQVLQTDSVNARGARTVTQGDQSLLMGFDFNINSQLSATLYAPYQVVMNRATGVMSITLSTFIPDESIAAPQGANSFRIVAGASSIDFEQGLSVSIVNRSEPIPLVHEEQTPVALTLEFPEPPTGSLLIVLGLEFSQVVNGSSYPLKSGGYNPMTIVGVEQPSVTET